MSREGKAQVAIQVLAEGHAASEREDSVAVEEPMEIRIGDEPVAVLMRTPGHDIELALGFLFSEGILSDPEQILSVA